MMKTHIKNLIAFVPMLLVALTLSIAMSSCGGDSSKVEDAADEALEAADETVDAVADAAAEGADAVADKAEQAKKAIEAHLDHSDLEKHVTDDKKVIHYHRERATYHPVALVAMTETASDAGATSVEDAAAKARAARPFDVPPMFSAKCAAEGDPMQCSHDEIAKYLSGKIKFPEEAKEHPEHREIVTFVVKADGSVDGSNILFVPQTEQCHKCAAEALRLVKEMPTWVPATKDGQPVDARVTLPIRFHEL